MTILSAFVEFVVTNTHSCIAPENLRRIFQPWYTRGKEGGTGLGLAIVQRFVRAHGGVLTVRSDAIAGTEFRFTLPAAPGKRDEDDDGPPASAPCATRVAVIEDDVFLREEWEAALCGHADVYESPELFFAAVDGLGEAASATWRCVITDYYFTETSKLTGGDVARWVAMRGLRVPTLLSSESSPPAADAPAFAAFLRKTPLSPVALDEALRVRGL